MTRATKTERYLRTFFEEKNLPHTSWDIVALDGTLHVISSEIVIEHIWTCNDREMTEVANVIRKIDFANGDINHFLSHLAHDIVENY